MGSPRSGVSKKKRASSPLQRIKPNIFKLPVAIPRQASLRSASSLPGATAVPQKHSLKPASSVPVTVTVEPSLPQLPSLGGAEVQIAVIPIPRDFSQSEETSASPPTSAQTSS